MKVVVDIWLLLREYIYDYMWKPKQCKKWYSTNRSTADENKDSSTDQIDSENISAVIQQTENDDQSQITGMYSRLLDKSGYKYI